MTLLASQYVRAGQNVKGYFGGGGDYRSSSNYFSHLTIWQENEEVFSPPWKISPGKFSVPPLYFRRNINQGKVAEWLRELHSAAFQWRPGSFPIPGLMEEEASGGRSAWGSLGSGTSAGF